MKQKIIFLFFVFVSISFLAFIFTWYNFLYTQKASIFVETTPVSQVFINGRLQGKSPMEINLRGGEITLKLIPESQNQPLFPFESKIDLAPGVQTIVRRKFDETEERSSSEIISFEKSGSKRGSISVISIPSPSEVYLNDVYQGPSPYKITNLVPGNYNLVLRSSGYEEKSIILQIYPNYNLTLEARLSQLATPPYNTQTTIRTQITTEATSALSVKSSFSGASLLPSNIND